MEIITSGKRILSIDSQILNSIQLCARKTKYNFVDNLRTEEKPEALERGDLMHKMLEVYYALQIESINDPVSEVFTELREAGLIPSSNIKEFAVNAGRYFATKMALPLEEVEETIFQFTEYCNYYAHDSWCPLKVEEVGSKVLYDDDKIRIIYNFKIDLIAEQGKIRAPFDHKTSKRRQTPNSLSNQFIGYCYGLGLNNIVINKIGFQKTLGPKERFNRFILTIDDQRIEEWVNNTLSWCETLLTCHETGRWNMNLTSCDKYSGCIFASLCESDPGSRLYKIERDFKVDEPWDVAKSLE